MKTKYLPVTTRDRFDRHVFKQQVITSQIPDDVARTAIELVIKWGMVAATPDGEDSSGRQKLRLSTPEELAERALMTSELLYSKIEERGHMVDTSDAYEMGKKMLAELQDED